MQKLRGLTPWQRTLYIMFFGQLMAAVGFSSIFPFLPLYIQTLETTTSLSVEFWSGLVFSAQSFTMMVASPIWGSLADRYGRKMMVQRALFGGTVLLLLMGFVRTAEQLVLLRAVQGAVTGTVSAANALVAANTPRERTGYAMGMLQVALWGGVALGPFLGGAIADTLGYRASFAVTAALLLLAGVLVWWGVEEAFVPPVGVGRGAASFLSGWRHILAVPGVRPVYWLRFLSQLGRMMIIPIAPLFIQSLLPAAARVNTYAGAVIGLSSAASTASAIYLGRLGDRVGHRRIFAVSALAAALLYVPQSVVTEAWQLLTLQALTGLAAGGVIPSLSALLAGYTQPGEEGSVYGLDNSIGAAGRAVAPLAGAGIAVWIGLRGAFVATAAIFVVMTLLALRLPQPRPGAADPVAAEQHE